VNRLDRRSRVRVGHDLQRNHRILRHSRVPFGLRPTVIDLRLFRLNFQVHKEIDVEHLRRRTGRSTALEIIHLAVSIVISIQHIDQTIFVRVGLARTHDVPLRQGGLITLAFGRQTYGHALRVQPRHRIGIALTHQGTVIPRNYRLVSRICRNLDRT